MRILNLCTYDRRAGGAAEVATRLFRALRESGDESRLLVQQRFSDDPDVVVAGNPAERMAAPFRFHVDALPLRTGYPHRLEVAWSPAWLRGPAPRTANALAPEIVHIHWGGHGFIAIRDLPRFTAPVVWTLHDAWAFTGGCHMPGDCLRYRESCGACPLLGSSDPHDLSHRIWTAKRETWGLHRPTLVAPSRWMADCARASPLFADARIEVIPNGLDTDLFRPEARARARARFNLAPNRAIALYSALNARRDGRKGFDLLVRALAALPSAVRSSTLLLVAGDDGAGPPQVDVGVEVRWLGRIEDEGAMVALYNAANVLAVPSRLENHSCAIAEAMACGLPPVAFDVGGNGDLIRHASTGFLARPEDYLHFSEGLASLLSDEVRCDLYGRAARDYAVAELGLDKFVERHHVLYRSLLTPGGGSGATA